LNVFENQNDQRATVIVFYGNRVGDIRVQDDKVNTLQARMGTGGGNMPLMAFSHTQGLDAQPDEDNFPTLRKEGNGAAIAGPTVRRLTPIECERLQGFPDGWTSHRMDDKKGLVEQADSARYKQMGNAVAVPVVEWVIRGLVNHDGH
jgi:DNA (cytosine-5)-methyltransferase 1